MLLTPYRVVSLLLLLLGTLASALLWDNRYRRSSLSVPYPWQYHLRGQQGRDSHQGQKQAIIIESNSHSQEQGFEFVVAGFPACGAEELLEVLQSHKEMTVLGGDDEQQHAASHQCEELLSNANSDGAALARLESALQTLSEASHDHQTKRGLQCPASLYDFKSQSRLEKHSPHAKLLIGVRHPIHMMEDFYNSQVAEARSLDPAGPVPTFERIMQDDLSWRKVSMDSARYELFLMQMGKSQITTQEMELLLEQSHYDLAIRPNTLPVFLYAAEQLRDDDVDKNRSHQFRQELQNFLGLTQPIQPFGRESQSLPKSAPPGKLNICEPRYAPIRQRLVAQGKVTATWIRDHFMVSKEVTIANRHHFLQSLESWGVDPCDDAVTQT